MVVSASEEPTSDVPEVTSKQQRRRETGAQAVEAGDRQEDGDRKRWKTGASDAATERGIYAGGSNRTGEIKRPGVTTHDR